MRQAKGILRPATPAWISTRTPLPAWRRAYRPIFSEKGLSQKLPPKPIASLTTSVTRLPAPLPQSPILSPPGGRLGKSLAIQRTRLPQVVRSEGLITFLGRLIRRVLWLEPL